MTTRRLMLLVVLIGAIATAAFAQSPDAPARRDEASRLIAEIRKTPDDDALRPELIDLLRGRTLRTPADSTHRLIETAASLVDTGKPEDLARAIITEALRRVEREIAKRAR